jgi:hypothetical protein
MRASTYEGLRLRIREEFGADVTFDAVEGEIRGASLPANAKAALWLYAWSLRDHGVQIREAEEMRQRLAPMG